MSIEAAKLLRWVAWLTLPVLLFPREPFFSAVLGDINGLRIGMVCQ